MNKPRETKSLLVALDIGTSKIVAIVAEVTPDGASAQAGEDVALTALPPTAPVAEVDAVVEGENGETAAPRIATV